MRLFVTGGAGFIGSALVRQLISEDESAVVINVDKLTYAGNLESLVGADTSARYHFERADICDAGAIRGLFKRHQPNAVIHLAAESHVDRSIDGPAAFIQSNIVGTATMLEEAREYWSQLKSADRDQFRFVHVSTDEVFGSLGDVGAFNEDSAYRPNSPYAASKAAADHLVRAWNRTFELPIIITNCSNNYGPFQFPEKLIPLMILTALADKPLPVYGDGQNVRDWLYVDDHCRALRSVLAGGVVGESYNVGGNSERSNLDVVQQLCRLMDELVGRADGRSYREQITFVRDRPGHDRRYAVDASKITRYLDWSPRENFESGLRKTVEWYLRNGVWCERIKDGRYRLERLGVL